MKNDVTTPIRRRAGLKEVATTAGLSVATVSRVLNNTGYIAEDTRARVLKAVEELDYQPNLRAKGLRQQRSHSIGLLIPNLLNAYYTALADAISQLLNAAGYQLLLSSTRDDPQVEKAALRQLTGYDVDGLIWVPTAANRKLLETLVQQHVPAVSVVRRVEGDRLDTIVFEDLAGSQAAMQHLIQLGHRRIGFIGGDIAYSSNRERWQGYIKAVEEAGWPVDSSLVKIGSLRETWGLSAMDDLLRMPQPPTAVFVASNALMPGVMKTLQQGNVHLPDDMSLVCFDDLDWFSFSNPPISAVSTSRLQLAETAVELLLQRIATPLEMKSSPALIRLNFELILRGSTAKPKR